MEERLELKDGDDKEYEVKAIIDSVIYISQKSQRQALYLGSTIWYSVWKGYPVSDHKWDPSSRVKHLGRILTT